MTSPRERIIVNVDSGGFEFTAIAGRMGHQGGPVRHSLP
jgi:hypothetical protein